jgi:hypothetical protein
MNPQINRPADNRPLKEEGKIDLRAAYLLFIRAYVRRQHMSAPPKSGEVTDA